MAEGATANASRENRKAIPVTCALHRGPRGFANLLAAERKHDGDIVLDPHVTGVCAMILEEDAATALFEVLLDVAAPMNADPATVPGARGKHQ